MLLEFDETPPATGRSPCTGARPYGFWLDTFAFQAPGFYEKLGYEIFGTLDQFPRGSCRHFLYKRLT